MKPVWIVDDDRSIRWVLEKTLAREQIPFKSFASATEALGQLDRGVEPPQVLVSDIRMPGQSGLELLQEVKQRFPAVPVIIYDPDRFHGFFDSLVVWVMPNP